MATRAVTFFEEPLSKSYFLTDSPAVNFFLTPAIPVQLFLFYKEYCPLPPLSFRPVEMQQAFCKNKASDKPL